MKNNNSFQYPTGSARELFVEGRVFSRNLLILFLFSLPVTYLGIILAVFIHEVVGHGLTAFLLGGQFNGFGIALDGLGWAKVEFSELPILSRDLVLFSGAFFTTVFALLFFFFSRLFKNRRFVALTLLFLAVTCLLDGVPYFFWDAIYLGGIGDFSLIWLNHHSQWLRVLTIGLGGLCMSPGIIFFNVTYYKIAYSWAGEGLQVRPKARIRLSLMILLLQVLGWFSFDWDQLIPGIGFVPEIAGVAVALAALAWLWFFQPVKAGPGFRPHASRWAIPLSLAWTACAVVVFSIVQWFQKGISFF